jgi:hypothetical protein
VECPEPQEKLLRNCTAHWHNDVYLLGSSLLGNCCLQGDYGVGMHCGHRSVCLGLIFRDETVDLVALTGKIPSRMCVVDDHAGLP